MVITNLKTILINTYKHILADDYFRGIVDFFDLLKKCKITPYVLLDGGYELKKLKTVRERLRSRIGVIKYIVPLENYLVLPLMIREVFTSALKYCNIPTYRCLFEADNEIAMLARKLDCPVLSYDSDFYIFDGKYIPYVTITPKVYKKTITSNQTIEVEIMSKKQKGQRKNPKHKNQKVTIEVENSPNEPAVEEVTYSYLDCCIYTIDNLTENSLDNDMLPLFGIMLGNDFISRKWFNKFYRSVTKRNTKKKKSLSPQQKRIYTLLNWLRHETLYSAVKKILECVKQHQRHKLWHQIRTALNGYRLEKSMSYEYFGFTDVETEEVECDILSMTLEDIMTLEFETSDNEEEEVEEEQEEEIEDTEELEDVEEINDGFEAEKSGDEDFLPEPQDEEEADEIAVEIVQRKTFKFPEWFTELFSSAQTPRFLVDLLRSHRYINYPQIEIFAGTDCNAISHQVLYQLYSILHAPKQPRLYYYTRIPKQVRFEVNKIEGESFPHEENFDHSQKKNVHYIRKVFERSFLNVDEIFKLIEEIPDSHQLYFLAVIYWIKRSSTTNVVFLQTILLAHMIHNIVDKKCDKIHRDGALFMKKYEKHLKELKEKEVTAIPEDLVNTSIKAISKSITKSESLLCMEKFVNHFSISPKFTRKHADFRRDIVHTFSELQSVIFNFYALNAVLQYPFENIRIENYFNGLFLYNLYLNLKGRANSLEYIKAYLLNHSTSLMTIFDKLFEICLIILPYLRKEISNVSDITQVSKVPKKQKLKKTKKTVKVNDCIEKQQESSDGEEFIDLNNKFSQLLMH